MLGASRTVNSNLPAAVCSSGRGENFAICLPRGPAIAMHALSKGT
jgi:hypothetical protein